MKQCVLTMLLILPTAAMSGEKQMTSSIEEVKKHHEMRLLELPGLVSVGIGLAKCGQSAIVIGLDGPNPETVSQVPTELDGYPIVIQIVGAIKAQ
jgi:hypothetical protein